jgi:hypothetical protein
MFISINNILILLVPQSTPVFPIITKKEMAQWHSWLKHCTTSWKIVGSIPDGVTGIFNRHIPSGRTVALRLTPPLTEMSTTNISWG